MYKITHYDYNCCPICDGTVSFFTEDIEAFQMKWFAMDRLEESLKEKFLRSKSGELVTDWYSSDDSELNIVQQGQSAVYGEKTVTLSKQTFEAHNAYDWPSQFYVDRWIIRFQWIGFDGKYYRLASYRAYGVCEYNFLIDRWDSVTCYGNPVLENTVKYEPNFHGPDKEKWDNPGLNDFGENHLGTICWLVNAVFTDETTLKADISSFCVTEEVMDQLFADVVGEGG